MKIAHIAPTSLLEPVIGVLDFDYHLVLVQRYLDDPVYAAFYKWRRLRGDFIILDVDTFETGGEPANYHDIARVAIDLNPQEIVLPDVWGESYEERATRTLIGADKLINLGVRTGGRSWFMAVPCGVDQNEILKCAAKQATHQDVRTIGLYRYIERDSNVRRAYVAYSINMMLNSKPGFKTAIHFLGCNEQLSELLDPAVRGFVRGIDTSKFVTWGMDGMDVDPSVGIPKYPGRPDTFWSHSPSPWGVAAVQRNTRRWSDLAAGKLLYTGA